MKIHLLSVLVFMVAVVGCQQGVSGPCINDNMKQAITLLDKYSNDYVLNAGQKAIKAQIDSIELTLADESLAKEKRQELLDKKKELENYLSLGEEIPKTTKELKDWAFEVPVK